MTYNIVIDELLSLLGSVGAVGGGDDDIDDSVRSMREVGSRGDDSSIREERIRAVIDELGSEQLLVPVRSSNNSLSVSLV